MPILIARPYSWQWHLHRYATRFGLTKVIVSTYQSASGAGSDYLRDLINDTTGMLNDGECPDKMSSLAFNCLPAVGSKSDENKFTEETKLENELRKILDPAGIEGLCYSGTGSDICLARRNLVVVETEKPVTPEEASDTMRAFSGIELLDDVRNSKFPTPRQAAGY